MLYRDGTVLPSRDIHGRTTIRQHPPGSLEKANKEELEKLDERLSEAQQTEGESDIADALRARANHFTTIGDKVRARPLLCAHCSQSTIVQYLG